MSGTTKLAELVAENAKLRGTDYGKWVIETQAENAKLREALEKMTIDRDEWKEASDLWREDANNYMEKWLKS